MRDITNEQCGVLHSLGYLYLIYGQHHRAMVLLRLAVERSAEEDRSLLCTFAYALILNNAGEQAIEVIDRLEVLEEGDVDALNMLRLLRSRALLRCGRLVDARLCFRDFMAGRAA